MEIIFIVIWLLFSLLIASIGKDREIGFIYSLLASLFFSPIMGALLTLSTKRKVDKENEEEMLKTLKEILDILKSER